MTGPAAYTSEDMMCIAAARSLLNGQVCFVGIGIPSTAANLALRTHAPDLVLIYESGCIGSKPTRLPLSIGDDDLADTALCIVSVPEIFRYWLQAGRVDVGFLGAAQLDRYGNLNTTVVGSYANPRVRLPGAGGAPEIAASSQEVSIVVRQTLKTFVDRLDFRTSVGYGDRPGDRGRLGLTGGGPARVITDLGVLEPNSPNFELELVSLHPGVTVERVRASTGWPLKVAENLSLTAPPTERELHELRQLRSHEGLETYTPDLSQ